MPSVTRFTINMGEQLRAGERTIRELVIFNDEEITDERIEERVREVLKQVEGVRKAFAEWKKRDEKLQVTPKRDRKKYRRAWWKTQRARIEVSQLIRVIEFTDEKSRVAQRVLRAWVLAKAAQYARAVAEARDLSRLPTLPPQELYNLACVLARCVTPARIDPKFGALAGITAAEGIAAEAVALLRRLHEQGYYRRPGNEKILATDGNLLPLWGRPDFRRLTAEVSPKK
jgi:hypothetical protein